MDEALLRWGPGTFFRPHGLSFLPVYALSSVAFLSRRRSFFSPFSPLLLIWKCANLLPFDFFFFSTNRNVLFFPPRISFFGPSEASPSLPHPPSTPLLSPPPPLGIFVTLPFSRELRAKRQAFPPFPNLFLSVSGSESSSPPRCCC